MLLRLCLPDALELDESELVVLGQEWRLGYGSQPPLYVWLQKVVFAVLGYNVLALALLKNLFLWFLFFLVFTVTRALGGQERSAAVAMLSLFLIPQIAWEGQRDLSHTLAALACTAGTWWAGWRALQSGRARDYIGLGFVAGLGILSKYNYALFLAQFILATWSVRECRAGRRSRWLWLSLGVFLVVVGPHLGWNVLRPDELFAQAHKLHIHRFGELGEALLRSFLSLLRAWAGFLVLPLGVYWVVFGNPFTSPQAGPGTAGSSRWMGRMAVVGAVLCAALMLGVQMRFKQRWLLPLLLCVPVFLSLRLENNVTPKRLRIFGGLAILLGLGYLAGLSLRPWLGGQFGQRPSLEADYVDLANRLREAGFKDGVIAAEHRQLGGNLKLLFPSSRVLVPELVALAVPEQAEWILVWQAGPEQSRPPGPLLRLAAEYGHLVSEDAPARFVEVPPTPTRQGTTRFGFIRPGRPRAGTRQ